MRIIADLHTHSRFAMACSSNITIGGMEAAAKEKGINLLGTGDFTHPTWMEEIKSQLEKVGDTGTYRVKGSDSGVSFIPSTEVSTVFQDAKGRSKKIHNVILTDDIEKADALNSALSKYGSLSSDGRPTLTVSAAELVETVMNVDRNAFVFPAHAWTPWFGVFGSISGFDSMKDAYEDQEKHIHALETGLSSDPQMNWRVSSLDRYALLSNSDFHSLQKMGREANVFELEKVTYGSLIGAIKEKDVKRFRSTIEFYPEEGKYHYDGHRACNFSIDPGRETSQICPVCGKRLTIGVLHRIDDLADRPADYAPKNAIPYVHIVPLVEVIAYVMRKTTYSKPVVEVRDALTSKLGTEFGILMDAPLGQIAEMAGDEVAEAIGNMRSGTVKLTAGYDGVFGKVDLLAKRAANDAPAKRARQPGLSKFIQE